MIEWITLYWDNLLQIYLAIVGIASIVVKLTPTLKDDHTFKAVVRFLGKYIALNRGSGDKKK